MRGHHLPPSATPLLLGARGAWIGSPLVEKTSVKEAVFIFGVVGVGVAVQVALGDIFLRPIVLALLALALLGLTQWLRGRRRSRN